MNLTLPRPGFRSGAISSLLAVACALACLSGVTFTGTAQADTPIFAPTLTVGQPVPRTDFPYQSFVPGDVSVVPDPDGSGIPVLKYTVANTDQPYPGANPRADVMTKPLYTEGSTLFTSIPVKIPAGLTPFYNNATSYFQYAEAKDTKAGTPTWALGLLADSSGRNHFEFGTTTEVGDYGKLWIGPVVDGGWHTFVIEAHYTAQARQGWVQLYMDGRPVTFNQAFAGQTRATGITTISDGAAAWPLDIDNYRPRNSSDGTITIYHGAPKIGSTLASVIGGPTVGTTSPVTSPAPAPTAAPVHAPAPSRAPVSVVASHRSLQARFTSSSVTSTVGQKVTFSSAPSTGTPLRYVWSSGRHVLGTGPTLTYRFHTAGTKHVRLKITGAQGATSAVSHAHVVRRQRHRSAKRLKAHHRGKRTAHHRHKRKAHHRHKGKARHHAKKHRTHR